MNSPPTKGSYFAPAEKKSKNKDKHKGPIAKEDESAAPPNNSAIPPQAPNKTSKKTKPSFKKLRAKKAKKPEEKVPSVSAKKSKKALGKDAQPEVKPKRPVFGVPLKLACQRDKSHDGVLLPASYRQCIDYVEEYCLSCEGIYRVPGVVSKVNAVINDINFNRPLKLVEFDSAIATSVIKTFLRELPEPVLTDQLAPLFDDAASLASGTVRVFQELLLQLPPENFTLLSWTMVHMSHVIARSRENRMNLENISIVLSPTLRISHRVLYVLFVNLHELFGDVRLIRYVPPLPAKDDMELPDTVVAIEAELAKQESLLKSLHDELRDGDEDPEKQNAIWEVQRVITLLKRKKNLLQLSDPDAIQNELRRQEDLLQSLHERSTTSSELWEVTSTITLLKRKLKPSKKPIRTSSSVAQPGASHQQDEVGVEVLNFTLRKVESDTEMSRDHVPQLEQVKEDDEVMPVPSDAAVPSAPAEREVDGDVKKQDSPAVDESQNRSDIAISQRASPLPRDPTSHSRSETPVSQIDQSKIPTGAGATLGAPSPGSVSPSHKSMTSRASYLSMGGGGETSSFLDGDLLQRVMHPAAGEVELLLSDDDEQRIELLRSHLMEDELLATRNDLKARIAAEQKEIDRLQKNIDRLNIRQLHNADSFDNQSGEGSDTSESSMDEEDKFNLVTELKDLQAYNERLEKENADLYEKIQQMRNNCIDLKIQLRTQLTFGVL